MKLLFYFILTTLFTILFSFLRPIHFEQVKVYQESWSWNKSSEFGLKNDPRSKENPKAIANGYRNGKSVYLFSLGKYIPPSDEGDLFEFPLLGKGYFAYKKIGDKVSYFSTDGEVLWKKPSSSYPISTLSGKINFLVSGDGNQLLVIDRNGNQVGAKQLDGNFFVDMADTTQSGSLLLFSGGEIYKLDAAGQLIFQKRGLQKENQSNLQFFKSIATSETGNLIAVHYFENNSDYISILDGQGNPLSLKIQLPHIYPHKIFLSIHPNGTLMANLRDAILLFDKSGKLLHKTIKKQKEGVYQISYCNQDIFIASLGETILFLNPSGELILSREIPKGPARIYPGEKSDTFFLETSEDLVYYRKL